MNAQSKETRMRSIAARLSLMVVVPLVFTACAATSTSPSKAAPSATSAPVSTATTAPQSITSAPSTSAAAKADGQIVFEDAGKDFQYSQIWIEYADGSNVRKLVSDDFTDSGPSLSPDGKRVVFYRDTGSGFGRIVLASIDGSSLQELKTGSRAKGCDAGVEGAGWSPDGRRLAFTRTCFVNGDFVNGAFVGQGLWTIEVDGAGLRMVADNPAPKPCSPPSYCAHLEDHRAGWSPDGRELVFERIDTSTNPERAAIFTVGVDGKRIHQVTPWALDGNDPVWSPDGTVIAFNASAEPSPTQNICTIRPDGTGLEKLTTYDEEGQATFHPSWSPDGTQILFSHSPSTGGWADFYVMNRDGSDLHILAATTLHENHAYWGNTPQP
jgi:Tol biopolymer transport system component